MNILEILDAVSDIKTGVDGNPDELASVLEILDLVGLHEIGVRLDVAGNTANVWRHRYPSFPAPDLQLAMGPVWIWARVARWARDTGRLK